MRMDGLPHVAGHHHVITHPKEVARRCKVCHKSTLRMRHKCQVHLHMESALMQGEKEKQHPIEYASRLLLKAKQNYSTTEREGLAVVWAVQIFRGCIEGAVITILTDHQQ